MLAGGENTLQRTQTSHTHTRQPDENKHRRPRSPPPPGHHTTLGTLFDSKHKGLQNPKVDDNDKDDDGARGNLRIGRTEVEIARILLVFLRHHRQARSLVVQICWRAKFRFRSINDLVNCINVVVVPEMARPRCSTSSMFCTMIFCTSCSSVLSWVRLRRARESMNDFLIF